MIQNQKIRIEIDATDWNDYESVIDFYESNQLYFDNKSNFAIISKMEELAQIQISYILALDKKKHYTKASKILRKVDILMEKLKNEESFLKLNERYLFASGMIAQRLKNFDDSQYYFLKLVKIDPNNDLYKNWYESNKDWFFNRKTKWIGFIGLALALFVSFFGEGLNMSRPMVLKLEFIGLVSMFGGFYSSQIKRFFKTRRLSGKLIL